MAKLTRNQKAVKQLESNDITAKEGNGTVYVCIQDSELELAEFEIDYQADNYKEKLPDCRKVGSIVYLVGEKGENNEGFEQCWELFNMSEEMNSGNSYSTYISDVGILPKATEAEILEVKEFLETL
jgi:hypothetical protein